MNTVNDIRRWQTRKEKRVRKCKEHVKQCMTAHALSRAAERNVRVKDIIEGRAKVQQRCTPEGMYITIIPAMGRRKRHLVAAAQDEECSPSECCSLPECDHRPVACLQK